MIIKSKGAKDPSSETLGLNSKRRGEKVLEVSVSSCQDWSSRKGQQQGLRWDDSHCGCRVRTTMLEVDTRSERSGPESGFWGAV